MAAYLSRPSDSAATKKSPGIIVIHEAFGLNEQIKGVARRYAEEGFIAIAPNLFARNSDFMNEKNIESAMRPMWSIPPEKRGDPNTMQELMKSLPENERKVVQYFFLGRDSMEKQMALDLSKCVDFLVAQPVVRADRLGITGFCMGGGLTYQMSTIYPFGAAVPFYGANPKPIESVAKITGPILAFYAGEDDRINAEVPKLVQEMIKQKKDFQMKIYKGAQHSFFNETRPVYNKAAAEDAWQSAVAFFNKHLRDSSQN